ncbi:NfeD family protein [Archaeoglobus sp.]
MRRTLTVILILLFAISQAKALIVEIDIKGEINQGTVELVKQGFDLAEREKAQAVLIVLDTPGGLLSSTKEIVSMIMNSEVPVITYVPKGAFSASAGTIILLAGHISAMANGTCLGSATPVGLSEEEKNKTINYVASYLESIAEARGKPKEIVRKFVTEGLSLTAREAYEKGVIDVLADSREELFEKVNGWKVNVNGKVIKLHLKGERIVKVSNSLKSEIEGLLSNPIVVFLLLLVGIYALIIGFSTPGIGLEVFGIVCLILALFGLHAINFDYLGLVLIIIGAILLFLELFTPTHGILAVASIVFIVIGSVMLVKEPLMPKDFYRSFLYLVAGMSLGMASFMSYAVIKIFQTRKMKVRVGEVVGEVGEIIEFSNGNGFVKVRGEIWRCKSDEELKKGDEVFIVRREGLTLWVKRKS